MTDDQEKNPDRIGPEDLFVALLFCACMFGLAAWILATGAGG